MYLDYFSLERHPFRITPDTSLFFSGGRQGRGVVLDAMLYAIETGEGILKVVGEVGSGKTMLCRMLEERLPESTEIVYIANPNLSPEDILYAIAFELKLMVRRDTSKLLVMQQLQNYLLKQHSANRRVLVIIEEAQGMPIETLEEIRLFSNLETHRDKLMQIILFGQPELDKNLSVKHIRQLKERITHSFSLDPLENHEVADYIHFRLQAAGCPCPNMFTKGAEWLIAKASSGLTRRINILADKALLSAFAEDVLQDYEQLGPDVPPTITWKHVYAAMRDSEYSSSVFKSMFSPIKIMSASMVIVIIALTFFLWPRTEGIASTRTLINEPNPAELLDTSISKPEVLKDSLAEASVFPRNKPIIEAVPVEEAIQPLLAVTQPRITEIDLLPMSIAAIELESYIEKEETPAPRMYLENIAIAETIEGFAIDSPLEAATAELAVAVPELSYLQNSNLSQQRIVASIEWLNNADREGYTVQLFSGPKTNIESAESFLNILKSEGLIEETYLCLSNIDGSNYWTIKYGNFPGLSVGQDFIGELPNHLHNTQPFVQNMSSVECNTNFTIAGLISE
ncbi:MAG: AAA family ATPase [Pseudomonadales bacterium]|nr:AAA family ATPase [Pseudomonadales bacterium]